eukprot:Gb_28704 [translate_table: standard]
MEEKFRKALQRSPQDFLALVEKHQSRPEKSALKTVVWAINGKTASSLCDALSLSTARAVSAFETLVHNPGNGDEEDNENFKTPSPRKKRRRRITRNYRSPIAIIGVEPENDPRKLKILNCLQGYSYLALFCLAHPHKAFSPSDLFVTVQTLHDKLVLFESDSVLQETITALCEQWWRESLPGKESLIAQSLPCLLAKSLSMGRKVDVHRIYAMREAFTFFDFMDDSIEDLKHLLIRCVVTPSYLRTDDGRRFVAFLFGLNAQLVKELIAIIRSQIPFGRNSILEAYGEILYRAWRVAKGSSLDEIEHTCIQGLVEGAIYASSKTLASSIRKVLGGFISQRTQDGVETFLYRLQEPILFRALQVANSNVRRNALLLLVDMFPLEDPDASKEGKETLLKRQFILLEKLLVDDCPDVRSVAVEGACRILRLFWEVVPSTITVKLLSKVVDEMAHDMSSSAVRCAIVDGMIYLIDNPQSHELLKVLLPRLAPMLDDPVLSVRTVFADLLLTLKDIRAIQFHKVVNLDFLLSSLATDHSLVAQRLTKLLIPSYFPSKVSIAEACNRFITLIKRSPSAGARFCEYALSEGVSPKSLIELVKFLISLVTAPADLDAEGKEGILIAATKLCTSLASNQSCKIALRELFSGDSFKCMLSSVSTPSAYTCILQIALIIPPKDISELVKHCGHLVMDCSNVLQNTTRHEEVRAAHKLILAWGGFDDLLDALLALLHVSSCIAGSGKISNELNSSTQDRPRKQRRKTKWPMKMSMKWSVMRGKDQSNKSGKDSIEESLTIAAGAAWHVENLLAEESTRKALLASSKLGQLTSGLKFLVQMIFQQHSNLSDCLVASPVRAYMALITHKALRQSCLKDARNSSSDKNKDMGTSAAQIGIDDVLQELLSWAEELFAIRHVGETSEDAPSTLQGKRKRVHGQGRKPCRREPLGEISNTTDAGGSVDSREASRIVLVGRIAATILKSIVDGSSLSLVNQVHVRAKCLEFASAFIQYIKLQLEKWPESQEYAGHDRKYILICMKSFGTYASKLLYLCLKSSNELAPEASRLANDLLDLIALSESAIGARFAMSILAALNTWMPDLLIALSSSANALCNDSSLESTWSKQEFNELAEEGKRYSRVWIETLASVELYTANIENIQETHIQESHPQEGNDTQRSHMENDEVQAKGRTYCATLDFMRTATQLLQRGDTKILQAVTKILVAHTALSLKNKDYSRALGLLHFICGKLLGCEKDPERGLDIVLSECLLYSLEETHKHIEKALQSLQGDHNGEQKLHVAKGLVRTALLCYRV